MNLNFRKFMEMFVHNMSENPDIVIAFRENIWLLKNNEDDVNKIELILKEIGKAYPSKELPSIEELHELYGWIQDNIPEALVAWWSPAKKEIFLMRSSDESLDLKSSPLFKKVVETLKVRKIGGSYLLPNDEEKVIYNKKKEILGRLPDILYHGTTGKYLSNILRFGLMPDKSPSNYGNIDIHHPDRVFLTSKFDKASYHAINASKLNKGIPIILEIKVPDKNLLQPDYDIDRLSSRSTYNFSSEPESFGYSVNSMKASLISGNVSYAGRIPATNIIGIYIFKDNNWKKINPNLAKRMLEKDDEMFWMKYGENL